MNDDVLALFLELAALPSPPGEERAVADRVLAYLRDLGLEAEEDDAGAVVGSTIGNLYVRIPGSAEGRPLFFCAHLDTVPPAGLLQPVVEDGVVRNAGGTILGGDNKAAVASMLHATRRVLAEARPHAGLELVFTPKEEVGLKGAYAFDASRLAARTGFVYDQQGPIGEIVLGTLEAEARSHDAETLNDVVQEMLDTAAFAASVSDCELQTEVEESYRGYRFKRDEPAVQLAADALERCGYTPSYALTGGGADANVFNERGAVADLEGMVDVTLALLDAALA